MKGQASPKDASCPFCTLREQEGNAAIVFEDERCLAFLDGRPLFPGHCLVIPRNHFETLADLPDELVEPLFRTVRLLSRAVAAATAADGSFVAINNRVSQSVPHLHVHVVPRRKGDGLKGFFWPRQGYRSQEEKGAVRDAIVKEIGSTKTRIVRN